MSLGLGIGVPFSKVVSIPWYLRGDIDPSTIVAIYEPINKDTLADSYKNVANLLTHELTVGNAPLLVENMGWVFDGGIDTDDYLITDIGQEIPRTWIVRLANRRISALRNTVYGAYETGTKAGYARYNNFPVLEGKLAGGNFSLSIEETESDCVIAIAGQKVYINGIWIKTAAAVDVTALVTDIGGNNVNGTTSAFFNGIISAMAIYDGELTAPQVLAVSNAIPSPEVITKTGTALQKIYTGYEFGTLICFNMSTFLEVDNAPPDIDVDTFAPTDLDIDQWLDACVAAGMNFATLTTKHQDGFCLWPTAHFDAGHDPYSIAETAWYAGAGSPDIVGLFVAGCNSRGLTPCLYFNMYDLTHEARAGTGNALYLAMIETQLTELLTNYGDLGTIWLDGWGGAAWPLSYDDIPYITIYNLCKAIQPNILVMSNDNTHPRTVSEIEIWEVENVKVNNAYPCEKVTPIRTSSFQWFYHSTADQTAAALCCLLYTSPSPRDRQRSRMPSSA